MGSTFQERLGAIREKVASNQKDRARLEARRDVLLEDKEKIELEVKEQGIEREEGEDTLAALERERKKRSKKLKKSLGEIEEQLGITEEE